MSVGGDPDTGLLLERAGAGDQDALHRLLDQHRKRLRHMVAYRLDRRLAPRLDASDVVQEALMEVAARLGEYLRSRPLPFYPWLRQLALNRLADLHSTHLKAKKRSVGREEPGFFDLPDDSAVELADRLVTSAVGPEESAQRHELCARVRDMLADLRPIDRELLILRHLEHLSVKDCAAALGVSVNVVKTRHVRALRRLRAALGKHPEDPP